MSEIEIFISLIFLCGSGVLFLRLNGGYFLIISYYLVSIVLGGISVLYISLNDVYLIEQNLYSYYHSGHVFLSVMIFLSFLGVWASERVHVGSKLIPKLGFHDVQVDLCVLLFCSVFVAILYLNIFVSGLPPFFSDGYIDRFGYLENTRLWPLLSVFGSISIHIPILLGYLFARSKWRVFACCLFLLYEFYLILIGQKFGGPMLGVIFFALPYLSLRLEGESIGKFLRLYLVKISIAIFILLSLVFYHYANYSLAEDFGGPLGLIIYRVFGMQGHMFWGVFSDFSWLHEDLLNLAGFTNAMQNLMIKISPVVAPGMIERGVNFTFGFYASIAYYFSFLAFLISFFSFFILGLISKVWFSLLKERKIVGFFLISNLLVMCVSFVSTGSLSAVINAKFFAILFLILIWPVFVAFFRPIFNSFR